MRRVLPRSPNWYCGSVVCSNGRELVAYGGTDTIQIMDVPQRVVIRQLYGHKDRVVALRFSPSTPHLLASCSVDGTVRLWDHVGSTCLFFHRAHSHDPTALAFAAISDVVVSGDSGGNMCVWSFENEHVEVHGLADCAITALEGSPITPSHAFVGFQSGEVLLVDTGSGTVVRRLSGHVDAVQAISWLCSPPVVVPEVCRPTRVVSSVPKPASALLLATSSRDKTIRVWVVYAENGRSSIPTETCVWLWALLKLTTAGRKSSGRSGRASSVWLMVAWNPAPPHGRPSPINHAELISTSLVDGELLVWSIPRPSNLPLDEGAKISVMQITDVKAARLTAVHDRAVFTLTIIRPHCPRAVGLPSHAEPSSHAMLGEAECSSCSEDSVELVTTSMDRQMVFWDLHSLKPVLRVPTLGGAINGLDCSAASPWKVVAAVADKTLRVWNLRRGCDYDASMGQDVSPTSLPPTDAVTPQPQQRYDVHMIWEGLQTVVTAVCCHPAVSGMYAFGTQAGIVGVYYQGKSRLIGSPHKNKAVYTLAWRYFDACRTTHEPAGTAEMRGDAASCDGWSDDHPKKRPLASRVWLLYSCAADGKIFEHYIPFSSSWTAGASSRSKRGKTDSEHLGVRTTNIKTYIESTDAAAAAGKASCKYSDITWRSSGPRFDHVALAHRNGCIKIYAARTVLLPGGGVTDDEGPSVAKNAGGTLQQRWDLVKILRDHSKAVNRIRWHPHRNYWRHDSSSSSSEPEEEEGEFDYLQGEEGRCEGWLASAGDDHTVRVFDLFDVVCATIPPPSVCDDVEGDDVVADAAALSFVNDSVECICVLRGHAGRVADVNWSPTLPNLLASASFDGVCIVWNTMCGEVWGHIGPMAAYTGHVGRVKSVIWHHQLSSLLVSAGDDHLVHVWDRNDPTVRLDPMQASSFRSVKRSKQAGGVQHRAAHGLAEAHIPSGTSGGSGPRISSQKRRRKKGKRKAKKGVARWESPARSSFVDSCDEGTARALGLGTAPHCILKKARESLVQQQVSGAMVTQILRRTRGSTPVPPPRPVDGQTPLAPTARWGGAQQMLLAEHEGGFIGGDVTSTVASQAEVLRGRLQAYAVPDADAATTGHTLAQLRTIQLWQGDLASAIVPSAIGGRTLPLDTQLLALAPALGYDVWEALCPIYARQLLDAGDVSSAVMFFLACHHIHDAVEAYASHGLFLEAIALAQLRLPPTSETTRRLYLRWTAHHSTQNNPLLRAQCFLCIGQTDEAIKSLLRSSSAEDLLLALHLAENATSRSVAERDKSEVALRELAEAVTLALSSRDRQGRALELLRDGWNWESVSWLRRHRHSVYLTFAPALVAMSALRRYWRRFTVPAPASRWHAQSGGSAKSPSDVLVGCAEGLGWVSTLLASLSSPSVLHAPIPPKRGADAGEHPYATSQQADLLLSRLSATRGSPMWDRHHYVARECVYLAESALQVYCGRPTLAFQGVLSAVEGLWEKGSVWEVWAVASHVLPAVYPEFTGESATTEVTASSDSLTTSFVVEAQFLLYAFASAVNVAWWSACKSRAPHSTDNENRLETDEALLTGAFAKWTAAVSRAEDRSEGASHEPEADSPRKILELWDRRFAPSASAWSVGLYLLHDTLAVRIARVFAAYPDPSALLRAAERSDVAMALAVYFYLVHHRADDEEPPLASPLFGLLDISPVRVFSHLDKVQRAGRKSC